MNNGYFPMVYGAIAVLSVLLLIFYILWEKKKERNFFHLIGCVAIANCGYFLLATANTLTGAMIANGISYFGAAFSVLAMLNIIWDVCKIRQIKWLKILLTGISTAAFLLAASGDWLGLYYQSVDIVTDGSMTSLVKDYGPLHILYTIYLLSYVLLMAGIIIYATRKRRLASPKYTLLLLTAVLLNIFVWAVEQGMTEEFEFLSVSYIVTEVILLLTFGLLRDYGILQPGCSLAAVRMLSEQTMDLRTVEKLPPGMETMFHDFAKKIRTLSPAERRILNYYIQGYEIADVPELAYISIHTVKKHNRSIYQKLEVASRDELMLYIELFRCCDRLDELIVDGAEEQENL